MRRSAVGLLALSLLLFAGSLLYSSNRMGALREAESSLIMAREQKDLRLQQDIEQVRGRLQALAQEGNPPLVSTRRTILQQSLALLEQQQLGRRYGDAIPYPEGWVRRSDPQRKLAELQNLAEEQRRLESELENMQQDSASGTRVDRLLDLGKALARTRLEVLRLRELALRHDLPLFARETPAMAREWDQVNEGVASEGHSLVDLQSLYVRQEYASLREGPGGDTPQAARLDRGEPVWTSDSEADWVPVRLSPLEQTAGFVRREALSSEVPPIQPLVDILDMDFTIVTRTNRWWKVAWLVRVKNRGGNGHDLTAVIHYLGEEGFVLDQHREYDFHLGPHGLKDFSGTHLVDPEIGQRIAGMRASLQPAQKNR